MIHDGCVGCGYLTVDDITRIYAVKRSYVYYLASTRRWGRIRHPTRGLCYRYEHVDDTLSSGGTLRWSRARSKVRT